MLQIAFARRTFGTFVLLAAGAAIALRAQAPPAGIDPVVVDFQALQADGKPVVELTSPQVTIKIDGRERKVSNLRMVRTLSPAGTAQPPPPPFATNAAGDTGRTFLFVVDEDSIAQGVERTIRDSIDQFLRDLGPQDRVGLVTAPHGAVHIDPTTAHARIREALPQINSHLPPNMTAADRACRTRDMLNALAGLLAAAGGGPLNMVVFSAQMAPPSGQSGQIGTSQQCELRTDDFQKVGTAAFQARARVYVIEPDTAATNTDGLEHLAGVTGGEYQHITTSASPLSRIAVETSAYFVATIEAESGDRNGQLHRLDVKVARENTTVRFAPTFTLARAGARAAALSPREIVKTTTAFRELPLRLAAYPSRGQAGKVQLLAMAEPVDANAHLTSATLALVDGTGRIVAQASAEEPQLKTPPIVMALPAAPGAYRLRFAAVDASGRMGAVDYTFNADLTAAGPLKLSGLVLGTNGSGGFTPLFQFTDQPQAVAYLEMYGQLTGQVSAKIEIAATPDGPAITSVQPGGRATQEPDKFILTAMLPIDTLAPGDYVVRAIVVLQDQPEGRVFQTLRKQ